MTAEAQHGWGAEPDGAQARRGRGARPGEAADALGALEWPAERLGDALEALALQGGLRPRAVAAPIPTAGHLRSADALGAWIDQAAGYLGVEAEPIAARYDEVGDALLRVAPALVWLRGGEAQRFLAVVGRSGQALSVLRADRSTARVPVEAVLRRVARPLEAQVLPEVDRVLERAGVRPRRRARARQALLRERLGPVVLDGIWSLRPPPGASFGRQLAAARIPRRLLGLLAAHASAYTLWILVWTTVGRSILDDHLDEGWLYAGALLLATVVPLRQLMAWLSGVVAIDASALIKQRLLAGALALDAEEVRSEGAGRFLGRVIESEAIEALAMGGGVGAVASAFELAAAAVVLAQGAAGALHALLLVAWAALVVALCARFYRRRARWTAARLAMTHDLIERLVGHRTRLAQERSGRWHHGEDEALSQYLARSRELDRSQIEIGALMPRGWLIAGIAGLLPPFLAGSGSTAAYAVALGGVLLASRALQGLSAGLSSLASAAIAWEQVSTLFEAAARGGAPPPPLPPDAGRTPPGAGRTPPGAGRTPPGAGRTPPGAGRTPPGAPEGAGSAGDAERRAPAAVLEAHELSFRHKGRPRPAVVDASLRIAAGDRILLEGPSGGGKSTLSALLSGLRAPDAGLLLLNGLDRHMLGAAAWRRRVAAAPQFHENYVLGGTFAYNLLMGRRWPPRPDDLAEAEEVCRELGLGELLGRMPAGLEQVVGETGWQLSHGERSRLYIARALLQGAEVVVLDESFAALDPETLEQALRCVLRRARTLVVIAHP
ncbi:MULTISPECIES: ATP-binding cassette domain-containing protein [Sorangium]|uniref:ABC transporter ATP-binding protein n=1 Tax=Sorangium cellulosum TaxID=56 RepID=A0A4P2R391_SORCE|nr:MULTISPECIES: ATP-binding cassette domain-containing protein [Sorangium]AUX36453.1 ABC transporter ATP-binding protein [Sorangium cellulosum]WCQ95750.1 ABC transporter [Sorangium sp. Soce836]